MSWPTIIKHIRTKTNQEEKDQRPPATCRPKWHAGITPASASRWNVCKTASPIVPTHPMKVSRNKTATKHTRFFFFFFFLDVLFNYLSFFFFALLGGKISFLCFSFLIWCGSMLISSLEHFEWILPFLKKSKRIFFFGSTTTTTHNSDREKEDERWENRFLSTWWLVHTRLHHAALH